MLSSAGWISIATSATPFPLWFYLLGVLLTGLMWLSCSVKKGVAPARRRVLAVLVMGWLTSGGLWEASYRRAPHFRPGSSPYESLSIIGDSVSGGCWDPKEHTWPKQLRERHHVTVFDLSQEGATARSAIRQADRFKALHEKANSVVVVEIGGNDYFKSIGAARSAVDLDNLLASLNGPDRQIVMLELPLPPFYNAYGRVQREIAAKHGIPMISKREFARVVFTSEATLDTVHLSESGRALMAEMIWEHVGQILTK